MKDYNYASEICEYCICTDFGCASVGTNQYNLCEGIYCEEAYKNWQEDNPEDNRELEEMF